MADSTLVHTEETTARRAIPNTYRDHLLGDRLSEMYAVTETYAAFYANNFAPQLGLLKDCRTKAWFVRHADSGQVRVASNHCNLRWCPLCSESKQVYVTNQVSDWLTTLSHPKILTLTLKHTTSPLSFQLKHLYTSFRLLRQREVLSKAVHGGVWFFQIKKSESDGLWHPHIHALLDTKYIPHELIMNAWQKITQSSNIVHIRQINRPDSSVKHIARYAARPCDLSSLPVDTALELITALHGKKLCGTWGTAKCISLKPERPEDADKWQHIGYWSTVRNLQHDNCQAAAIVFAWLTNKPLEPGINMNSTERVIEGYPESPPDFLESYQPTFFDRGG